MFAKKTVHVASVVYPLGEEPDRIPDMVQAAVITSSLRHTSVPKAIRDTIIDGAGVKLSQGFAYARNSFWAGLPTTRTNRPFAKDEPTLDLLVKEHLKALYPGETIVVTKTWVDYGDNYVHVFLGLMFDDYSYDYIVGETFAATGAVDDGATVIHSGPNQSPDHPDEVGYHLDFTNPDYTHEIIDKWWDAALFAGAEVQKQRVVMVFTRNGGPNDIITYEAGGSNAMMNIFLRKQEVSTTGVFPAIILKRKNHYINTNRFTSSVLPEDGEEWRETEEWKTSNAYARRMNIKLTDIIARVKENESDDDIDYTFIQPGTLINSETKAGIEYHYNYFNRLYENLDDNKPAYDTWAAAADFSIVGAVSPQLASECPSQSIHITDSDNTTVNVELSWRYISYEVKSGVVDEWEVECGAEEVITSKEIGLHPETFEYDITKLYFRKQLTETTYGEICVCGAWHENYVYPGKAVQSSAYAAFNDPEGDYGTGFLIPLDYDIFKMLSARERLQLGQEAFHMVFNCYVVVKQKWYQTGFFKVFMLALAIFIIFVSWGTMSQFAVTLYNTFLQIASIAALGATAAAAVAGIFTALVLITMYMGVSLASQEVGEWAAEKWGPMWGALAQMGTAYALTWGLSLVPGVPPFTPVSLVGQLSQAGSFLLMGMSAYTQYQYVDLVKAQDAWKDYINSPTDSLQVVNEKLEEMFPGLSVAQEAIMPAPENLDQFLGRTLTTTDGLTGRLLLPITSMVELTLTPRL